MRIVVTYDRENAQIFVKGTKIEWIASLEAKKFAYKNNLTIVGNGLAVEKGFIFTVMVIKKSPSEPS